MARARRRTERGRTKKVRSTPVETFSGDQPTDEQRRHRPYALESLVDEGQVRGRTFRRQPLYVTLSKTSSPLTPAQRHALDLYRETFDRAIGPARPRA